MKDPREVEPLRLPVLDTDAHIEQVDASDQVVETVDAKLRHQLARFLGHEEEIIHHVLGLAGEAAAQHGILGGDAGGAGVQVTLAHHDAALQDRKSTRLNSSHPSISYAVFCLKKKR